TSKVRHRCFEPRRVSGAILREKGSAPISQRADKRRTCKDPRTVTPIVTGSCRPAPSTAFRIPAIQAGHATVEHHGCCRVALRAELSALGKTIARERILLAAARFELGLLLREKLFLVLAQVRAFEQADLDQVLLDDVAELGNDRRHELAAGLPVAAARIEDGLELVDEERHVAALA